MKLTPQQLAEIREYLNESPSKPFDADAVTIVKLYRCGKALSDHIAALEDKKTAKRLCPQCNTGNKRCSESHECFDCHTNNEHITALEAENKALLMYIDHKRWCIKRDPDLHHTRDCNCRFDELLSKQEQE